MIQMPGGQMFLLPAKEFHKKRLVGSLFMLRLMEINMLKKGNMLHMSMLNMPRTQLTAQLTHNVWSKFLCLLSISKAKQKTEL